MSETRSLSSSIFRSMMAILLVICLMLGTVWLVGDFLQLHDNRNIAAEQYIEGRKAEVRDYITQLVTRIGKQIEKSPGVQAGILAERTDAALGLAENLYRQYAGILPEEEIVVLIREALRPLRFDGGTSSFFILDLDGTAVLAPETPKVEGRNLPANEGGPSLPAAADLIDLARRQGGGLYAHEMPAPGAADGGLLRRCHVRLFEPLGLVIGSGQSVEDYMRRLQARVLGRIRDMTVGEDGYVFVNTYQGKALVIKSHQYAEGDNVWEMTDPTGLKVIQEERRAVENPAGDFIYYSWNKPGFAEPVPKVSFIQGIPEWNWMLGTGVYLDEVQGAEARAQQEYRKLVVRVLTQVLAVFLITVLLALVLSRRLSRKIQTQFRTVTTFFRDAAVSHNRIDRNSLVYEEFRVLAGSVNEMIEERAIIEEELLKARNLESLGVLAGGIAHDFNNLLTAIMGNLSLAMLDVPEDGDAGQALAQAERVSLRASDLTQQLLAFAKGGAPVRSLENLEAIITESARFSLRGSNVELELDVMEDLWGAEVDAGQFSQVVGNLVINADQAMPDGGRILVRADNDEVRSGSTLPLPPGPYVRIEVRDGGCGIPPSIRSRIFDPYFTTKSEGHGLGLASVYAIVKNHSGFIQVESEPGEGSVFTVWIPARLGEKAKGATPDAAPDSFCAKILVMDDDAPVLEVCRTMLTKLGCRVEGASRGEETLELYRSHREAGEPFDLVILDLTVRGGMGGQETLVRLKEMDPDVRAIVSSGYSNDPVMASHQEYGFQAVIRKPYNLETMRETLGRIIG